MHSYAAQKLYQALLQDNDLSRQPLAQVGDIFKFISRLTNQNFLRNFIKHGEIFFWSRFFL